MLMGVLVPVTIHACHGRSAPIYTSSPTWLQSHLQTSFWIRDIDERKKVPDFLFVDWNPNIFSLGHYCVTGVVRCTVRGAW